MKRIKLKYIVYTFFVLLVVVFITFILLFQRNIRTAASVKKLEDGLYSMEYKGDYNLDDFLEQGGAPDDLAVAEFVIQDVFHGLLPIDLRGSSFGCSTISARTPEGDAVFLSHQPVQVFVSDNFLVVESTHDRIASPEGVIAVPEYRPV